MIDNREARVDLGQALRRHGFAYRPESGPHVIGPKDIGQTVAPAIPVWHDPVDILALRGLMTAQDGVHVVAVTGNPLANLALLGKI